MYKDIENIRYDILSRGNDVPETLPAQGEIFNLDVHKKLDRTGDLNDFAQAEIHAKYVEWVRNEFNPTEYAYVYGDSVIDGEALPSVAKYQINAKYPAGETIGELVAKREVI